METGATLVVLMVLSALVVPALGGISLVVGGLVLWSRQHRAPALRELATARAGTVGEYVARLAGPKTGTVGEYVARLAEARRVERADRPERGALIKRAEPDKVPAPLPVRESQPSGSSPLLTVG
jgi:hypothetical protein